MEKDTATHLYMLWEKKVKFEVKVEIFHRLFNRYKIKTIIKARRK